MQLLYGPNGGAVEPRSFFATPSTTSSTARVKRVPAGRASATGALREDGPRSSPPTSRWIVGVYRIENTLARPWVLGYKKHIYFEHAWKYFDIDLARLKHGK